MNNSMSFEKIRIQTPTEFVYKTEVDLYTNFCVSPMCLIIKALRK